MDPKHLKILKFLFEQNGWVYLTDFPNSITSDFTPYSIKPGSLIHELQIVLCNKGWIENNGYAKIAFRILPAGKEAIKIHPRSGMSELRYFILLRLHETTNLNINEFYYRFRLEFPQYEVAEIKEEIFYLLINDFLERDEQNKNILRTSEQGVAEMLVESARMGTRKAFGGQRFKEDRPAINPPIEQNIHPAKQGRKQVLLKAFIDNIIIIIGLVIAGLIVSYIVFKRHWAP